MNMFRRESNRFKTSVIMALFIFIAGYGVMSIFWLFYPENAALKGLNDFYAVKYGDSVCLPLMIGSGHYYTYKKCDTKKDKTTKIIIGSIGGVIGFCIQVSWLMNPNIIPNWTIPYPHHFNAAGWYHAAFFVMMVFLVGYYLSAIVLTNIKSPIEQFSNLSYYVFWVSAIIYSYMHMYDDCMFLGLFRISVIISSFYFVLIVFLDKITKKKIKILYTISTLLISGFLSNILYYV